MHPGLPGTCQDFVVQSQLVGPKSWAGVWQGGGGPWCTKQAAGAGTATSIWEQGGWTGADAHDALPPHWTLAWNF